MAVAAFAGCAGNPDPGHHVAHTVHTAPDGFVILAADYSQIELRIMAHLSQDAGLVAAFTAGTETGGTGTGMGTKQDVFKVLASRWKRLPSHQHNRTLPRVRRQECADARAALSNITLTAYILF